MEKFQLVVGSESCPIKTIQTVLLKSPVIQKDWSQFARGLEIPDGTIKVFRQDLLLDKITFPDLIYGVLELWTEYSGSNATLAALLGVVEGTCEANRVGESLRLQFNLCCKNGDKNPSIEWKELSPEFQKRVIFNFKNFFPHLEFAESLSKLEGADLIDLMMGNEPSSLLADPLPVKEIAPNSIRTKVLASRQKLQSKIAAAGNSAVRSYFKKEERKDAPTWSREEFEAVAKEKAMAIRWAKWGEREAAKGIDEW